MSDLARLLPDGFAQTYWDAFGELPPADFLEAYELLCELLYHGARLAPEPGDQRRRRGKRVHGGYFFGEPSLLGFKTAVDHRLAAIRAALRGWAETSARSRARRPRPRRDGRGDLAPTRRARGDRPATDQEET